jgi:hypothetical protein
LVPECRRRYAHSAKLARAGVKDMVRPDAHERHRVRHRRPPRVS